MASGACRQVRWVVMAMVVVMCRAPGAAQQARRIIGTDHLRVLYWPQSEELAKLAAASGDEALARLRGMLDAEPPERIDVYIVRSQAEFDELTGGENDPWIIGRALPSRLRVVVKPMGPQRLPGLLAHELAHVMLDVAVGEAAWSLPRWVHEGVAQYAAHDFGIDDQRVIARASLGGKLLTIDELEGAFSGDREQVALAYAQSYTLVAYLSDLEPAKGIRPLLEQLAKGRDVRQALGLAFGLPVPQMEEQWLEGLRTAYLHTLSPPPSETIVGALFVIAFVIALVLVRRRSAGIRRRMNEQERLRKLLEGTRWEPGYPREDDRPRPSPDEEFFIE